MALDEKHDSPNETKLLSISCSIHIILY